MGRRDDRNYNVLVLSNIMAKKKTKKEFMHALERRFVSLLETWPSIFLVLDLDTPNHEPLWNEEMKRNEST